MSTNSQKPSRALVLFLLVVLALYLAVGWLRSTNGLIHAFDSGLYLQLLTNIWENGSLASSVTGEPNFLGHHFQPVVLALSPLMALSQNPFVLLLCGAVCLLAAIGILLRSEDPRLGDSRTRLLFALIFLLHPSSASRVFYSFVPEVLALPFLTWIGLLLLKDERPGARDLGAFALFQLLVLACKESLIPQLAVINLLMAWKWRRESVRWLFLIQFAVASGAFFYIFRIWMPAHSSLASYYALDFYKNPSMDSGEGLLGISIGALGNLVAVPSLETAFLLFVVLTCGLALFGSPILLLASAWPSLLILASSSPQIHSLMNHYALPVIPFLILSALVAWNRFKPRLPAKAVFYGQILILLLPFGYTLMADNGYISYGLFALQKVEPALMPKAKELEAQIPKDDAVLIDGSLQALFPRLQNAHVILGFKGNPYRLRDEDFAGAKHVITTNDLAGVKDCEALKAGGGDLALYDYQGFYRYCRWLKSTRFEKTVLIEGRLIHMIPRP